MSAALHVVFKVDGAEYAIAAADVLQMESYAGATFVPGAPAFVAGIVHVRGRVVPVVDLRRRFGLDAIAPTLDSRLVVVQQHERVVALLADAAREVLKIDDEQMRAPPSLMAQGGQGGDYVKAVAQIDKRLVMLVDVARIIGEEPIHVS